MRLDLPHKASRRSGPYPRIQAAQKLRGYSPLPQKQHGFGLVAAMFLIIVIAAAIAAMWRISVTQTATSSLALQQARAYQAARAGLEWGIYQFVNNSSCSTPEADPIQLDSFIVVVKCPGDRLVKHDNLTDEGFSSIEIQGIIATATYLGPESPDYVYRKLTAEVERPGEVIGPDPDGSEG